MKKQMVTYIKDGLEKTISFNFFQELKLLGICSFCVGDIGKKLEINENIEFIHFKNISFKDLDEFTTDFDTICIFEDCFFKTTNSDIGSLELEGGEFEFINCYFNQHYVVHGSDVISFNVIYTKNVGNNYSLNLYAGDKSFGYPDTVLLRNKNTNVVRIDTYSKDLFLQNNFEVDCLSLMGENITIGNNDNETVIKSTAVSYDTRIIADEELRLVNCTIDNSNKKIPLRIDSSKIEVSNVTLKSKSPLILKGITYFSKDSDKVVVTDKDVSRANFVQFLKVYHKYLENNNILRAKNILQEEYDNLELKKKQLYQDYLRLLKLEEEKQLQLEQKKEMIIKGLSKKKVKDIRVEGNK